MPQITMDYATFCVHNMREFECACGAASCRRMVQGTDYLQPWVERVRFWSCGIATYLCE
jgi:hypothetical protein